MPDVLKVRIDKIPTYFTLKTEAEFYSETSVYTKIHGVTSRKPWIGT